MAAFESLLDLERTSISECRTTPARRRPLSGCTALGDALMPASRRFDRVGL